jgi:acylglycerol lipase
LTFPLRKVMFALMEKPAIRHYQAHDGYSLAYRRYDPPAPRTPAGIVIYLHGIQSHGGWYEASCRQLAESGLRVYFPDRRGSGLNEADRGHCQCWEQLADDVIRLQDVAEAEWNEPPPVPRDIATPTWYRRPPVILMGVSWGGKLATALAAMHGGRYAGLTLLCPGIKPQRDVSLNTKLSIAKAVFGKNERQLFDIPLNDPALFTATPQWLDYLRQDPLILRQATARFLFESRRLDGYLEGAGQYVAEPVLLMLAGHDRIIDNRATMAYAASLGRKELTVRLWGEAHHTLEFEPRPAGIFRDLGEWCAKCCREYDK